MPRPLKKEGSETMWQLVYTRVLDKADSVEAEVETFETKAKARAAFVVKMHALMKEIYNNEYLKGEASIHGDRAVVSQEDIRHVVAIVPAA